MKNARLIRIDQSEKGTFGVFLAAGGWWYTMELPWRDNKPSASCIPAGDYECHLTYSPALERDLYVLSHVTDRCGIRIHPANYPHELEGCIALGNRYSDQGYIVSSGDAVVAMHRVMKREPFILTIQEGMGII